MLDRIELSLERAFAFIKKGQNRDGLWSDFMTLAGESVYWVSGYVGYSLTGYRNALGEASLEEVYSKILEQQGEGGGWGYGPGVPADADSTSWCLRFLSKLASWRIDRKASEKALEFLFKHQDQFDGGFKTYASPNEVARYMRLEKGVSFEGWCSSQNCVTAVTTLALMESGSCNGVREALNFIRRAQSEEGYWEPYWWSERLYSTFYSMKALRQGGNREGLEELRKAQDWIAETQLRDGGWSDSKTCDGVPFSTALALRGLMLERQPEFSSNIESGVYWLLTHQIADGGWSSHHILRIPHPTIKEPWKLSFWKRNGKAVNALIRDHNRLYSTATAFIALLEFKESLSKGEVNCR